MAKNSTFVATLKFVDAFTPGFSKAITEAEKANQKFTNIARTTSNLGSALQRSGAIMTAAVTTPIVALGKKAMDTAAGYEGALSKIMTLQRKFATNGDIDLTNPNAVKEFGENVKSQITDLSNTYGVAQTELANSYYTLASAFNDTSQIQNALVVSTKMSIAGNMQAADSAKLLATAYNAYGDEAYNSIEKVGDIMASTEMYGFTTIPELAESLGQVIPTAAQAGMSLEDLATSMAVITSTGVNTSIATTYLKNALNAMIKQGDRKAFSDDGFLQYLETLKDEMPEIEDQMAKFKNIRARSGVTALLGNTDLYKTYHEAMGKANGTLDEMFETVAGSKGHSMRVSMTQIDNALQRMGERILPVVSNILERVAKILDGLSDEQIDGLVTALTAAAAAGPGLMIVGTAMKVVGGAMSAVNVIKGFVTWINDLNPASVGALETAANSIGGAVGASAGITGALTTAATAGLVAMPVVAGYEIYKESKGWSDNPDAHAKEVAKRTKDADYKIARGAMESLKAHGYDKDGNKIGNNASGTSRWRGGLTSINEHGGEVVDLPTGSRIYPANQSAKMSGITITIPKLADTISFNSDRDIDIFTDMLADKLVRVVANS